MAHGTEFGLMMADRLNVVAISGALHSPSPTEALLDAIVGDLEAAVPIVPHVIRLSEIAPLVGGTISRTSLPSRAFHDVEAIEAADLLIVAVPACRGSYPGLFKHLFDFVSSEALVDVPVLIAVTDDHGQSVDGHLRSLFGNFEALTLPAGVSAMEGDFDRQRVANVEVSGRIEDAVNRALPWLALRRVHR